MEFLAVGLSLFALIALAVAALGFANGSGWCDDPGNSEILPREMKVKLLRRAVVATGVSAACAAGSAVAITSLSWEFVIAASGGGLAFAGLFALVLMDWQGFFEPRPY
ncbi:hypothetical protein HYS84_00430 [Candidatus Saccharibacteria bacterium]|nr:hypothetical protein [Candidatus Saccharibacteria bacterium]